MKNNKIDRHKDDINKEACVHEPAQHRAEHSHRLFTHHHSHGEGSSIDYQAYHSKIRGWNPTFKFLFTCIALILCIGLDNPYVSVTTIVAMGFVSIVLGGVSFHDYLSTMMLPITFILLGTLMIGIDFSLTPKGEYNFHFGFFYIITSKSRLLHMGAIILKVFGAISTMITLTLSTPATEIVGVLRKLKVPKLIIELMNMIYRYIFVMMDTYRQMKESAESRLGFVDYKTSLHTFAGIASNIFVVTLKRSGDYYNALESRCYEGELLFLEEEKPIKAVQAGFAVLYVVVVLALWWAT
ncbi:MAG: cobalt ECF transporter T component CbiQ [Eubacteriaceae bacterium]|jgi:cobalt/nickel transport system permease protein|nr:cobalt ECF transporter T component CbiQ [Eubacteriaceae bacterium]